MTSPPGGAGARADERTCMRGRATSRPCRSLCPTLQINQPEMIADPKPERHALFFFFLFHSSLSLKSRCHHTTSVSTHTQLGGTPPIGKAKDRTGWHHPRSATLPLPHPPSTALEAPLLLCSIYTFPHSFFRFVSFTCVRHAKSSITMLLSLPLSLLLSLLPSPPLLLLWLTP